MPQQHVLIVDDEAKYRALLSDTFSDLKVSTAESGKSAISVLAKISPDVILLDLFMPDIDGYEVCRAIRSNESTALTPIVFYSGMDSLEGKLKAYDLGGNDFIGKDRSNKEIRAKVMRLLSSEQEHKAIVKDLEAGACLVQNMQKETSALHLLSHFSQASQFCFDYETLATVLFNCLIKLNLRGVVYFRNSDDVYSSSGSCSKLEEELLKNASSFGRIHSFCENRVIFNWESCALLVKDVDDDLDTMAHFMGAVQTAIHTLEMHKRLIDRVIHLENQYQELKGKLSGGSGVSSNLREQLFDSGLISRFDFDVNDKEQLDDILNSYGKGNVSDLFAGAEDGSGEITKLLKRINTPPDELQELFEKRNSIYIESEEVDDMLF